jgi:hypothetical protein
VSRFHALSNLELARCPCTPRELGRPWWLLHHLFWSCPALFCIRTLYCQTMETTVIGSRLKVFPLSTVFSLSDLFLYLHPSDTQKAELRLNTCLLIPFIMPWRLLLEPSFELDCKIDTTQYMDLFLSRFSIEGKPILWMRYYLC